MDKKGEQATNAVRLYYEHGSSQVKIVSEIGASRPIVTKLLQCGEEAGFVTIEIYDPREKFSLLIICLEECFALKHVRVVHPVASNEWEFLKELGCAGAELVESLAHDGMDVGASWECTMNATTSHLRPMAHGNIEIVQLKGGTPHSDQVTDDSEVMEVFYTIFNANARYLPLPAILDDARTSRIVESGQHIVQILEMGRRMDLVVFAVSALAREAPVLNPGRLHEEEIARLLERSVRDACSCSFTISNGVAVPKIDTRMARISLVDLAPRSIRVLVARDPKRAATLKIAMRMGLATHVIVDQGLALVLLLEDEAGD